MAITVNIIKELKVPNLPNFLLFKDRKETRGMQGSIDIGELDEEGYSEFKEQYIEALDLHWANRRKKIKKT